MSTARNLFFTALVVAACVGAVYAGRLFLPTLEKSPVDARMAARSKGNPKGDLWIVSYSDFQCLNCRKASPIVLEYLKKYPRRIYYQARLYPLIHNHAHALQSALYADCAAAQGRFWPMYQSLFDHQSEWSQTKDPTVFFDKYAAAAGVDPEKLRGCVENPATKELILKDMEEAKASLGINTTPTFFLNGKKVVGPAPLKAELSAYFQEKNNESDPSSAP